MLDEFVIFALGIIAGAIVTIGLDLFRFYFFRPRLRIQDPRPEIAQVFSCHSLVVRNRGRRVAKNAQGFISVDSIEAEDIVEDSQIKLGRHLNLDPTKFGVTGEETVYLRAGAVRVIQDEPLCWAAVQNRERLDIYPGTARLIDVCRFIKPRDFHQIHIPTAYGWQVLLIVLRPRAYRITIKLVADDARVVSEKFTIQFQGDDVRLERGWL